MAGGAVIGVDLGGTTLAAGLVDPEGTVLCHGCQPTHERGPGTAVEAMLDVIERLGEEARARAVEVTAVGIGVPGTVDAARGTVGPGVHYVPELSSVPLADLVAARTGLTAYVDALALGEWRFGAARGARSLVLLALGTGVGGGVILEGRLLRGAAGFGGELGHVPIKFDGRACVCGGRGCLKAYVSGTDIGAEGSRRLGRPVTAREVFALARQGEAAAAALVGEVCEALGAGLAVVVNGLNPEWLLVGGGVAESLRPLRREILASVGRYAYAGALAATRIEIVGLDKIASVRGGAALVQYEAERGAGAGP
jgi:glucokinase